MKAIAVILGKPKSAHITIVDKPQINDDEVLVKVKAVGIDGTDKEINDGLYGEAPEGENKLIIGHESLGEVVETGKNVKSLRKGDLVVATVRRPCKCINCEEEEFDMCLEGKYTERGIKGKHGFLSEYYKEQERFLVKIPKKLGILGVLLEPMSIAEKAIRMAYSARSGFMWKPKVAMITGTGSLGLLTAIALKLRGLDVISVDRSDGAYKDIIFKELQIKHFNSRKTRVKDIPANVGKSIDVLFEETGNSRVAIDSISAIGTNGVVVLTSITGGKETLEICADTFNLDLVLNNKAIVGVVNSHRKDFEKGIEDLIFAERKWPGLVGRLITASFRPEDINDALYPNKKQIKALISFDSH